MPATIGPAISVDENDSPTRSNSTDNHVINQPLLEDHATKLRHADIESGAKRGDWIARLVLTILSKLDGGADEDNGVKSLTEHSE